MIKILSTIFISIWCAFVALGVDNFYTQSGTGKKNDLDKSQSKQQIWEMATTKHINVPIVRKTTIIGYLSVQFSFQAPKREKNDTSPLPNPYLIDEAFRVLYGESAKIGMEMEKYKVKHLTELILDGVQKRIGKSAIKDLLLKEFNFIAAGSVR